eukprot:CAMPEP_0185781430 /NCGR_PEP_ID=MMETSP1174-20130828/102436_1 /TAXON_ID=35687 /ORGANISM="Dictyocha speculum, Strain CCMP1381" /LENGTH=82 /DNA_ID=CAMNT_0028471415 /DNA_START=77 /DNA_END=326 /DNA_ORIENTATION=-
MASPLRAHHHSIIESGLAILASRFFLNFQELEEHVLGREALSVLHCLVPPPCGHFTEVVQDETDGCCFEGPEVEEPGQLEGV